MSTGGGGGGKYFRGWTTTTTDVSSACDDVNQDQQYGRGSTYLCAACMLAMNGRGYTVHNESSASGQSTRTSSMGGAPPLLAMNGQGQ